MPSTDPPSSSSSLIAEAFARWRRAAESARDGLWEVRPDTGETWFSDRFASILGLDPSTPAAAPQDLDVFVSRIHADDRLLWDHAWKAALSQGAPILLQVRLLDSGDGDDDRGNEQGTWRWVVVRARCWTDEAGRTVSVAGSLTDIHEERVSQQALERLVAERTASLGRALEDAERGRADAQHAREAQSRFLAHMSHELRTPLAGLLGLVELSRRVATDAAQHRYLEVAMQSGHALQRTIEQVLELTRLRDGELSLASEPFDAAEALAEVVRSVMPLVRPKGLSVRYDWTGEPTWVRGDEPRLRQIVSNLVGNAAKFTEQGYIALNADLAPDPSHPGRVQLRVDVEDTGPGLAPDRAARIFDDFVQGDASLSRAHGGTGLGLSIARDLARRMGGDITLRSTPGVGSVFSLSLCLDAAPDPAPLPDPRPGHAWLVYRQTAIGVWLQRRLLRLGWTADLVEDVGATIRRARSTPAAQHPALVVLAEHALLDPTDLPALRLALPAADITLLIRPDWDRPEIEQQARALGMSFNVMPLSPRDLRLMTSLQRETVPAPAPPATRVEGHVLVVEDNAVNRMIAEEFLHALGIPARTADDGAQALVACAADPPRLVLMDLQMPVMDGLAAARVMRERQQRGELPAFPIVALTAHAMDADAEACRAAGMNSYLTKPLMLESLRDELARWWPGSVTATEVSA